MQTYLLRRLVLMVPTLLGVTFLVFLMLRSLPGDVTATLMSDTGAASPELRETILEEFGLHEALPLQYGRWLADVARLDLGTSFFSGRSVNSELASRLGVTAQLGIMSLFVSVLFGIPLGILSAARQNTWIDHLGRSVAIGALAAPSFWIALLLITFAGRYFEWGVPSLNYVGLLDDPVRNLKLMAVPSLILGASSAGVVMRYTRATMLEAMRQDYVRTARAKGVPERAVVMRHALRNALLPVVTVIGMFVPAILGGAVIIESIYSLPGMGRYYVTAVQQLDLPVIQAINLLGVVAIVSTNLLVDIAYALLDPRIRYS